MINYFFMKTVLIQKRFQLARPLVKTHMVAEIKGIFSTCKVCKQLHMASFNLDDEIHLLQCVGDPFILSKGGIVFLLELYFLYTAV